MCASLPGPSRRTLGPETPAGERGRGHRSFRRPRHRASEDLTQSWSSRPPVSQASGNFDYNDNTLRVNGFDFGNWSNANAEHTDSSGATSYGTSGGGFRDSLLDTGFFCSNDSTLMGNIFGSLLSGQQLTFQIFDLNPYDNFYDFTQGIDGGLINVGLGPVVPPPRPGCPGPPDWG